MSINILPNIMKTNSKKINKINKANLDSWLATTGYLYPITERQLDSFNLLYKDYDFKLKDVQINIDSILSDKIHFSDHLKIKSFDDYIITSDVQQLKMAARKGESEIPDEIIQRMKKHHTPKDEE